MRVYAVPKAHDAPDADPALADPSELWRTLGTFDGQPKVRERLFYERMKEYGGSGTSGTAWGQAPTTGDIEFEKEKEKEKEGGCQKFYTSYTEKKQTGGVMALWCRHSVCLSFHCIPRADGRNDVFSAIFTRWRIAPKWIVYDFACALAPYCLSAKPSTSRTHLRPRPLSQVRAYEILVSVLPRLVLGPQSRPPDGQQQRCGVRQRGTRSDPQVGQLLQPRALYRPPPPLP